MVMEKYTSQISYTNRVNRVVIGAGLIAITMFSSGPLGYLALLPLLAIYPLATGMIGEDPIDGVITRWFENYDQYTFRPSSRAALLFVGAGAIGMVMLNPTNLAATGWLTLAAVYPIMAGMFGEDLVEVTLTGMVTGQFGRQYQTTQPVVGISHRQVTVQGHHHKVSANSHHKHAA